MQGGQYSVQPFGATAQAASATLRCLNGAQPTYGATIQCTNGAWGVAGVCPQVPPPPPAGDCRNAQPPAVQGGQYSVQPFGATALTASATLSCLNGAQPTYGATIQCTNGAWGVAGVCPQVPPPPPPAASCTATPGSPGWPVAIGQTNPGWQQTTATTATLTCGWSQQLNAMTVPSTAATTLSCTDGAWGLPYVPGQPYNNVAATCVAQGVGRRMQEDTALELDAGEEIGGR